MPADHAEVVGARYELTRELARDSTFAVYEAEDHQRAAVAGVAWSLEPVGRGRRGRNTTGQRITRGITRFDHPHLIATYDHGIEDGRPFVAFRRPPSDLATELALAPFAAGRVAQMGASLSSALESLHRAHLRLEALHPGHVGVDADGTVRLSPWPLALPPAGWGGEGAWSPPESLAGATPSNTGDIWSLGAVLLSALIGTGPGELSATDTDDLAHRLRSVADPTLLDAVGTSMAIDPSRRFASAGDMAKTLQRNPGVVVGPEAIAAGTSSRWSRPGLVVPARAATFTSAAVVVITSATAAGMSLNALGGGSLSLSCAAGGSCTPRPHTGAHLRTNLGGANRRGAHPSRSPTTPSPTPIGSNVSLAIAPVAAVASVDSVTTPFAPGGPGAPFPPTSPVTPSTSATSADNAAASPSPPVLASAPATASAPTSTSATPSDTSTTTAAAPPVPGVGA
ncbi:MAG TPA: hypothetical protein VHZ02_11640, partial [Acidimicrobiales bacterium]|nr:hypothetical protein [Acidimicrobiales bacterium]